MFYKFFIIGISFLGLFTAGLIIGFVIGYDTGKNDKTNK